MLIKRFSQTCPIEHNFFRGGLLFQKHIAVQNFKVESKSLLSSRINQHKIQVSDFNVFDDLPTTSGSTENVTEVLGFRRILVLLSSHVGEDGYTH